MNTRNSTIIATLALTATLGLGRAWAGDLTLNGNVTVVSNTVMRGTLGVGNWPVGLGTQFPGRLEVQSAGSTNGISIELSVDGSSSVNASAVQGLYTGTGTYGALGVAAAYFGDEFPVYYGVYGNSGSGGYAGWFDGPVEAAGTFAVGGTATFNSRVGIGTSSPVGSLDVEGNDDSGSFAYPVAQIQNTDTGNSAAPALRLIGWGNAPSGVLSVSANGTGLIAQFGNYSSFVADIQTNGTIDALSFHQTSDRNVKQKFLPVNAQEVLAKVATLPVSQWEYKAEPGALHLGPVAQDFRAAFGLGEDDRHIATVDEEGVALAAIQGLNQKLEAQAREKDVEIQALKARLEQLESVVQRHSGTEE